jgi:hypothetical protein
MTPTPTPKEALQELRLVIESQGPDTPNRHYGRNQFARLVLLLDTVDDALKDTNPETESALGMLNLLAEEPIEQWEDVDSLANLWLTADDIAARMRARLLQKKYWWEA